jgi:hypothetical protein
VLLERAFAPDFKLLAERLVEATNGAGTGSDSQERLGHFAHFVGARPGDKHLGEPPLRLGLDSPHAAPMSLSSSSRIAVSITMRTALWASVRKY